MLFRETKEGNSQDFMDWLFHTFQPLMWRTAKKYCPKDALWEEIIRESLVHLLACAPNLQSLPKEKLAGYILVTIRHSAGAMQRKEGTLP